MDVVGFKEEITDEDGEI